MYLLKTLKKWHKILWVNLARAHQPGSPLHGRSDLCMCHTQYNLIKSIWNTTVTFPFLQIWLGTKSKHTLAPTDNAKWKQNCQYINGYLAWTNICLHIGVAYTLCESKRYYQGLCNWWFGDKMCFWSETPAWRDWQNSSIPPWRITRALVCAGIYTLQPLFCHYYCGAAEADTGKPMNKWHIFPCHLWSNQYTSRRIINNNA